MLLIIPWLLTASFGKSTDTPLEYTLFLNLITLTVTSLSSKHKEWFLVWHGVIFIRSGIYKGGKFKFLFEFPKDFPKKRPNIRFTQKVYHPLIDTINGALDLDVMISTFYELNRLKLLRRNYSLLGNMATISSSPFCPRWRAYSMILTICASKTPSIAMRLKSNSLKF